MSNKRSVRWGRRRRTSSPKSAFARLRRLIFIGLVLVVAVVVLAPRLASLGPIRSMLIRWATGDIDGRVEVGEMSFGWLATARLADVKLTDTRGNTIAQLDELKMDRNLLTLLFTGDYGTITIVNPQVNLLAEPGTTNLERVLARVLNKPASDQSSRLPKVRVQFIDGLIQIASAGDAKAYQIGRLNGQITANPTTRQISLNLGGMTRGIDDQQGQMELVGEFETGPSQTIGPGRLHVTANTLASDFVRPILLRLGEPANCRGLIGADVEITWTNPANQFNIDVHRLSADRLALTTTHWLQGDQLSVNRFSCTGQIQQSPKRLSANQLQLETEFAQIQADGEFDWQQLTQSLTGGQLPSSDFNVSGRVDLCTSRGCSLIPLACKAVSSCGGPT